MSTGQYETVCGAEKCFNPELKSELRTGQKVCPRIGWKFRARNSEEAGQRPSLCQLCYVRPNVVPVDN